MATDTNGVVRSPRGDEESLELPMLDLPNAHPCNDCGECCEYLAIEIDNPTNFSDYENLHWYLTHENVSVYIDHEGDWFIEFKTRCRHLTTEKTCGIYTERPKICSEFSWNECERTTQDNAYRYRFLDHAELLAWMEQRRPSQYAKYVRKRRELIEKRRKESAKIAATPAASTGPAEAAAR